MNGNNIFSSGPAQTNQDSGTIRGDQNFGNNNQLMFRYSQFDQQVANTTNIIGLNTIHVFGHNYIGHWTHTFNPTAFSDVYFGRNYGDTITGTGYPSETAAISWAAADPRDVEVLDDSEQQALRTAVVCG